MTDLQAPIQLTTVFEASQDDVSDKQMKKGKKSPKKKTIKKWLQLTHVWAQ